MSDVTTKPALDPESVAPADGPPEKHDVAALHAPIMREKLDPRDGYEPVPLWLVAAFGILVFWGGWYLATYSGGFRSDVLDEDPAVRYAGMAGNAGGAGGTDPVVLGSRIYSGNCVSCHQQSGQGVPGQYPPLAGSEWVAGSPARLARLILHGVEGPIQVKGAAYNSAMPPLGGKLTDGQVAAVLTFVRTNAEWGNTAGAVTAEQVAAARAATRGRAAPMTEAELLAVTAEDVAPATKPAAGGGAPK